MSELANSSCRLPSLATGGILRLFRVGRDGPLSFSTLTCRFRVCAFDGK